MVLPAAVWGALRFGVRTATLQLFAISAVAVFFTSEERGPLFASGVGRSPNLTATLTQLFLISSALVLLPLAVVVAQRAAALGEISSREDMFRQGFSQSLLGMMLLRRVGGALRVAEFNDQAVDLLGVPAEQLMNSDWLDVVRDGVVGDWPEPGKAWRGELRLDIGKVFRWLDVAVATGRLIVHTLSSLPPHDHRRPYIIAVGDEEPVLLSRTRTALALMVLGVPLAIAVVWAWVVRLT